MKYLKRLLGILIAITSVSVLMTGCEKQTNSSVTEEKGITSQALESTENSTDSGTVAGELSEYSDYFSNFDLQSDYNNVTADIKLNGDDVQISGSGAEFSDKIISITTGGTFVFSGVLDDGQIFVNAEENVQLVFNGVNITNLSSAPVYVENAKNVAVTLVDNTENVLSDTENYVFSDTDANEPDAALFSKDDLSINGNGSLTVNANYNEGIATKNDLRISGGKIAVNSKGDSVKGKDSVVVQNADITINSEADGIKTTNTEETDKGFVVFESGNFDITAQNDAVQSENFLNVNGGTFNIMTGEGAAAAQTDMESAGFGGRDRMDRDFIMQENQADDEITESQKGLKSNTVINVNGGAISADCSDDAVHAAVDIQINGGELSLSSGDDGIHCDNNIKIANGNIRVLNSYEGIEGIVIDVDGGYLDIVSSDDCFNSSDGTGGSMDPMAVSENCVLNINDGYVYVNSGGDALDSNGILNINGGLVLVDGPENDGNSALDSGSEINVNGGTLIAAGSSGMLELPNETSGQNVIVAAFENEVSGSTPVYLTDENGDVLFSYIPSKKYSAVIISSPEITTGSEYSVYCGGTVTKAGDSINYWKEYSEESSCSGGELIGNVTVSSTVTTVGNISSGMMGGGKMGGFGGQMPPDGEMGDGFGGQMPPDGEMGDGFGGQMPPDGVMDDGFGTFF
ncbi:MAG: carbohydrate-binding domain-containing protein [Ruminococcus sp.]|nr:carbohydrate-binding domain-containing protein [Ruminococcus sp.]